MTTIITTTKKKYSDTKYKKVATVGTKDAKSDKNKNL